MTLVSRTHTPVPDGDIPAQHRPSDPPPTVEQTPGVTAPLTPDQRRIRALRMFAASITALNVLGQVVLGFEQAAITPITVVLVAYASSLLFEWIDAWAHQRAPEFAGGWRRVVDFLLPAHITGLACGMLLYANATLWPYLFAVVVATGSKYVVRIRTGSRLRHVLNPSNTGIVATLLLFPWVGISPPYHFTNGVWGTVDWLIPLGILMLGLRLNAKLTGKLPLILAWVGGFVLQAFARWLLLGHSFLGALGPITGVAFVLFTNYMITDPATTPFPVRRQVVFGLTVAAVYGILVVSGVSFGLFFALVITCVLRGIVVWAGPRVAALFPRAAAGEGSFLARAVLAWR